MFPFGAAVTTEGQVRLVGADPASGEHPASQDVLGLLYEGARQTRADRRAVAFAADVLLKDGADAVRIELEHRDGTALVLLVPYTRSRFKKTVALGQMSGGVGERRIWND
jgi:hypothetical protein